MFLMYLARTYPEISKLIGSGPGSVRDSTESLFNSHNIPSLVE